MFMIGVSILISAGLMVLMELGGVFFAIVALVIVIMAHVSRRR